ncbi:MAG TPA: multicopper oxidase [Myxococcales bacterium]|nr:multicopper oxidase [Myxococcales bacterium]
MRKSLVSVVIFFCALSAASAARAQPSLLDPATQPRWVNPLPIPETYVRGRNPALPGQDYYEVRVTEFKQWMGLIDPITKQRLYTPSWGYGQVGHRYDTGVRDALGRPILQTGSVPGPTFETRRGKPVAVKWINDIRNPDGSLRTTHLLGEDSYDLTLHGTSMGEPHVRTVMHLHGAETPSASDGFPEFWFTADPLAPPNGLGGPRGNQVLYQYPNQQPGTTLWYHDHSLGITRLNVYTGQEGFFFIREPDLDERLNLPGTADERGQHGGDRQNGDGRHNDGSHQGRESGQNQHDDELKRPYEIPLMIADRMFNSDGSLSYINAYNVPGTPYHPNLAPEFFGDFVVVNGMAWPYLDVEPRKYRFRVLNASNARVLNLRFINRTTGAVWTKVYQIGSDGGFLRSPVPLSQTLMTINDSTDNSTKLMLAPAERADVVVDFTGLPAGTEVLLVNDAGAPFPDGAPPDPDNNGSVMLFKVLAPKAFDMSSLPAALSPIPTRLDPREATVVRHLTLTEVEDPTTGSPVVGLINNTCWDQPVSETPALGTTEIWEITDTTPDTHPIHVHLVQFNVLDRQLFDKPGYLAAYNALNEGPGMPGPNPSCSPMTSPPGSTTSAQRVPDVAPYLVGTPMAPPANEAGWKDTVRVKKDTVTRFLVRIKPQDPAQWEEPNGGFGFDPTVGSYIWHCHILEHEDNEMMRPLVFVKKPDPSQWNDDGRSSSFRQASFQRSSASGSMKQPAPSKPSNAAPAPKPPAPSAAKAPAASKPIGALSSAPSAPTTAASPKKAAARPSTRRSKVKKKTVTSPSVK